MSPLCLHFLCCWRAQAAPGAWLRPAACCPCSSGAINEAAMCSQLERGWVIALGRFMVGRCEMLAVCLPPCKWLCTWAGRLLWGQGDLLREKVLLSISRVVESLISQAWVGRCLPFGLQGSQVVLRVPSIESILLHRDPGHRVWGSGAHAESTQGVLGEESHTGISECISGFQTVFWLLRKGKKKGA